METQELADSLSVMTERLVQWLRDTPTPEPLSPAAASVLMRLRRSGPMRVVDLTRTQHTTQPAVTQLVTRLEDEGFVERIPSPTDGRSVLVQLTEPGAEAVEARHRRRAQRLAEHLHHLEADERAALAGAMPALEALVTTSETASEKEIS